MFIVISDRVCTLIEIEVLFNGFNINVDQIQQISETEFIVIPAPRERCAGHLESHYEKHGAWFYSSPFCCTIDNYCTASATP